MEHSEPRRSYRYKQNRAQQLRGFYHVVTSGSFTEAARQMHVEQPTISMQVQALERELRVRLLDRSKREVTLTAEGQMLFEMAAPLVEGIEALEAAFQERLAGLESGQAVCAAPESFVMHILPGLVKRFKEVCPNISLVLHCTPSSQVPAMVLKGEADLGIAAKPPSLPSNIRFVPMVSYDNYLVCPLDHPLADKREIQLQEIARYPLVAPLQEGTLGLSLDQTFANRHLTPIIALRVPSSEARFKYVAAGLGVTVTSRMEALQGAIPDLCYIPISGFPQTNYGLLARSNTYLPIAAQRFADFILASCPFQTSSETQAP